MNYNGERRLFGALVYVEDAERVRDVTFNIIHGNLDKTEDVFKTAMDAVSQSFASDEKLNTSGGPS
jgi:hypothetical protein